MKFFKITYNELSLNKKKIFLFSGIASLLILGLSYIFNPELFAGMEEIFKNMPEVLKAMFGGQLLLDEYRGFLNVYLFSFAWMYFGLYLILRISQDIPTEIEEKTIDIILSKPIKRWEFVFGKFLKHLTIVLLTTILIMGSVILSIFIYPAIDPNSLNYGEISLAFLLLFVHLVSLISTGLLFSTLFNRKSSLAFSFGMLIFFYITGNFWTQFPESAQGMKYISIFYYFNTNTLLLDHSLNNLGLNISVLSIYSIVMIFISLKLFKRRNIPV